MENNKTIFVTGATGNQGGAVAKNLLSKGFIVKALTRNPDSSKATGLKELNVQIVKGDLNNADTYRDYLKDVDGIFSVQTFENGVDIEVKQGIKLATVARELAVNHFVYSSALGTDLNSGVSHIESKLKIENHLKQSGLPFTIIRPSSLYENFLIPQVKKGILKGKLVQPANGDTILQYIASDDIGKAAAKIFENKEMYIGRTIPLAAEQLTTLEVAQIFSDVLNKKIEYKKLPALITRLFIGKSVYKMFKWMDEKNRFHKENVDATKKEFPNLISLKSWVAKNFQTLIIK